MSTANRRCIQRPYSAESTTSEEKETWVVDVPAVDYIRQAFFGALSKLGEPTSYNPLSDVAAEYGSEINASLRQIQPEEINAMSAIRLDGFNITQSNGTVIWVVDAASANGGYWGFSAQALGNSMSWERFLSAGNYEFKYLYMRNTDGCVAELQVQHPGGASEHTETFSIDGTLVRNSVISGSFTVETAGFYWIYIICYAAGSVSTDKTLRLQSLDVWRVEG